MGGERGPVLALGVSSCMDGYVSMEALVRGSPDRGTTFLILVPSSAYAATEGSLPPPPIHPITASLPTIAPLAEKPTPIHPPTRWPTMAR